MWLLAYTGGRSRKRRHCCNPGPRRRVGARALTLLRTAPAGSHQGKRRKENLGESVTQGERGMCRSGHTRARTHSHPEQLQPHPSTARGNSPGKPQLAAPTRASRPPHAPDHLRCAPPRRCARHPPRARARRGCRGQAPDSPKGSGVLEDPPLGGL